jgi:hypothetical protein
VASSPKLISTARHLVHLMVLSDRENQGKLIVIGTLLSNGR